MQKTIREMSVDEIITRFLQDRGLNPADRKFRAQYDPILVRKAKAGDTKSLVELLRVGEHFGPGVRMF